MSLCLVSICVWTVPRATQTSLFCGVADEYKRWKVNILFLEEDFHCCICKINYVLQRNGVCVYRLKRMPRWTLFIVNLNVSWLKMNKRLAASGMTFGGGEVSRSKVYSVLRSQKLILHKNCHWKLTFFNLPLHKSSFGPFYPEPSIKWDLKRKHFPPVFSNSFLLSPCLLLLKPAQVT